MKRVTRRLFQSDLALVLINFEPFWSVSVYIGGRDLGKIMWAIVERHHYVAARNMLRVYSRPINIFWRYLFKAGKYPIAIGIHTPVGPITMTLYSHDDLLTTNEVFCRLDYRAATYDKIIVDFGSNIGISAAYFLTRSLASFVYLFEPLEFNNERLRANLASFTDRYTLDECAVGLHTGNVQFGWEESGRYGGVGLSTGMYVRVPCKDSNDVLERIIAKHGRIDILKIDIETLEREVTLRIPLSLARRIGKVYVEYRFDDNPLAQTHNLVHYGGVAQFTKILGDDHKLHSL